MFDQIGLRAVTLGGQSIDPGLDFRAHADVEAYRATALMRGDCAQRGAPAAVGALLSPDDPNVVGFVGELFAEVEFKVWHTNRNR